MMTKERQQVMVTDKKGEAITLYQLFNIDPKAVDPIAHGWSPKTK